MPANLKLTADSGGGTTAIAAPSATTGNANLSWKLPVADGSANQLLKTDGSGNLGWATDTTGLTVADQWRVTSSWTGNATPITSNWERVDHASQGTVGTAMTESSGVFTFPETGIYFVAFGFTGNDADTQSDYIGAEIKTSVGGGGYAAINSSYSNTHGEGTSYGQVYAQTLIDVTVAQGDTNPTKVTFDAFSSNSSFSYQGGSTNNHTYATFLRLGDT